MRWSATELRWRDALLSAILPAPGGELPALASLDQARFWQRFDESAPLHLKLGLRAAVLTLGALPPVLGFAGSIAQLDPDERERFLTRALDIVGVAELVEVAKVVACLAYFNDPRIQATVRR